MSQTTKATEVIYLLTTVQAKQVESSIVAPVAKAHYSSFEAAESLAKFFGTEPEFATWQATQDYTIKSLVANHKIEPKTASNKWYELTKILELSYDLVKPRKPTKAAGAMAAMREALAAIPEPKLKAAIAESAKAGNFKDAQKYQGELARREKVRKTEAKKAESKDQTALKSSLKKWVGEMDSEKLAALVWIRENFETATKLMK
jgi:hypothetical protein